MRVYPDVADFRNFEAELLEVDLNRIVAKIPSELLEELKDKKLAIAGGFIRSILRGEPINDIDLFRVTEISPVKAVGPVCTAKDDTIKTEAIELSKELGVGAFLTTDNAVSFEVYGHTDAEPKADHVKVQYIIRYTSETVKELLQKFDFTNSMAAIWYNGTSWDSMCHNGFYGDVGNSTLTFNSALQGDKVILMKRFLKFVTNGWKYTIRDFASIIEIVSGAPISMQDAYKILSSNRYGTY